ncbi:MAG: hypothetical protein AMXMBFR7_24610 [Planctomycetota bacterium]
MSDDGRYLVFESAADNLVLNDTNTCDDVFRYDTHTNERVLVSVNAGGTGSANDHARNASVSADGMLVAFVSRASNLHPLGGGTYDNVYVRDLLTQTTYLASVNWSGTGVANGHCGSPCISADGTHVAYVSHATNLSEVSVENKRNIYVRNLATGTTFLASINHSGTGGGNGDSQQPILSANGSRVVYYGNSSNLHPLDADTDLDVFVRDISTGSTYLASINETGTDSANGHSFWPDISADGSRIAFTSYSDNLHPLDSNGIADMYVRDLSTHTTILASMNLSGTNGGNSSSEGGRLSADGRRVVFQSGATDRHLLKTHPFLSVFVRDLADGVTYLASVNHSGTGAANSTASGAFPNSDGSRVAFISYATNLSPLDSDSDRDVYVWDQETNRAMLASVNSEGTGSANRDTHALSMSANGLRVAFSTTSNNLHAWDLDLFYDVYVAKLPEVGVLGNFVFHDSDNDGLLEPGDGELGLDEVAVCLYRDDGTDPNQMDESDTFLLSTVTAGGGYYSFSKLPDGDYIIQIAPSNFLPGQVLSGYQSSALGEFVPDPDNDVDGDNNGVTQAGLGVVCKGVTIATTHEPSFALDGDGVSGNLTVDFGFVRTADLVNAVVTVAESTDPVTAGSGAGNLVYTITVTNNGPSNASGVTLDVTPTLPSGVTLDDADASAGGYTGGTWTLGSLAAGGSSTLTLTLTAGPSAAHSASASCATSNLAANEPLIETGDDADTESTAVQRRIDLELTKSAGESMPAVGSDVTYTLTVTNHGPSDASGVEVTDLLPAGLAYVSDDGGGDFNDATGIWTIGTLADGAQAQLGLTATVTVSGEIVNTAQVSDANETDTDSTPNNGTDNGEDDEAEAPVGAAYIGDAGWKILSARYTLNIPKTPGFDSLTLQAKLEFAALQAAGLNIAQLGAQTFQLDFGGAELPAAALAATAVTAKSIVWQTARGVTPAFKATLTLSTGILVVTASNADLLTALGAPFVAAPQANAPQPVAVTLSLGTFNSTVVLLTNYTRKSATSMGSGSFKWGSALNDWPDGLFFVDKATVQQRTSKGVVQHRALLTLNFLPAGGADFDPRASGARLVIGDFNETVGNDPLLAPFVGNAAGTIFSYRRPTKNTLGAVVPLTDLQLMQFQKLKWLVTATSHWLPAGAFGTPQIGIGAPATILLPLELEVDGQISGTETLLRLKGTAYQK